MITRMSVCISDSVYSIWSFTWQKHDANFDMHIVFFYLIESNWIHVFFRFFFLVIVSVLISASFLLRFNLFLIFYTCWRLNYGSCLVHWTKVVLYWFVFIRFVRWLLMTSSKREYSHSHIFWNELHKQCYKLAIESYEFNLFRSNRIFFFQFIFGLHNLIFCIRYKQKLRSIIRWHWQWQRNAFWMCKMYDNYDNSSGNKTNNF